ncbi:MAG: hypothetical protein ABJE80_01575 [Reichenbachiella sp.]|uniref:hypothetical protein n=1 Tax=Reichenbachiella sp. TaxID=2184521 RepID=UPI0032635B88
MKTISKLTVIAILILLPVTTFSQTLKASLYSAFKLSSRGATVGVQLPGFIGDIEFGAFYDSYEGSYRTEQDFSDKTVTSTAGIYTTFSMVSVKNWDVSIGAKVGTTGDGIVINPGLGLDYYVNNYFGVGLETKLEVMKPVIQGKLVFNVFGGQNRIARQSKYARNKEYFKSLRKNRY